MMIQAKQVNPVMYTVHTRTSKRREEENIPGIKYILHNYYGYL